MLVVVFCMFAVGGGAVMQDPSTTPRDGLTEQNRTRIALHKANRASNGNASPSGFGIFDRNKINRARIARKNAIKNHIEKMFDWKGKSMPKGQQHHHNISLPSALPQPDRLPRPSSAGPPVTDYTERVQSFFPECEVDDKYLLQIPTNPHLEVLFFKVKFPVARPGAKLSVIGATLRLYKMGTGIQQNCRQEHKQRITVSWLKLNRSRARQTVMLDSIMLPSSSSGWTEFDVSGAVSHWHKRPRKPAALVIEVEDNNRLSVSARNVIQPLNCTISAIGNSDGLKPTLSSGGSAARPAPRIQGGPSFSLNSDMHPLIDITTLEVPYGEDVPTSLPFFGHNFVSNNNNQMRTGQALPKPLPQVANSLSQDRPPVRNVEIVHRSSRIRGSQIVTSSPSIITTTPTPSLQSRAPPQDNHSVILNKLEEIDYLGGTSSSSQAPDLLNSVTRRPRPYGAGPRPGLVFQRVIMTREDLELRLRELLQKQDSDKESERGMLMQVVQDFMEGQ